jgi:hypothetical protein
MSKLRLTVACGDYEIVRALKEGAVTADGIELSCSSAWACGRSMNCSPTPTSATPRPGEFLNGSLSSPRRRTIQ